MCDVQYHDALKVLKSYSTYYNGRGKKYPQLNCPVGREILTWAISFAVDCINRCKKEDKRNEQTYKDGRRFMQDDNRRHKADATRPNVNSRKATLKDK